MELQKKNPEYPQKESLKERILRSKRSSSNYPI